MRQGDRVGPFVIEKALGSGAMGTVFRARHTETGQHVAIKVVAPALAANPSMLERFKRESAILKQLKHPNIVRLVATGRHQGTPFYAMEYVEGKSLDRVLARRGRIEWQDLVGLGQQLCAALQHVHERGIIHRDLKPSNVLVLPDGTVKLTDFGIAKDTDLTALTAANCTVGTASYMSPEQCKGARDLTPRSDLYSLGVLFFELLTGRKPFEGDSPMQVFMQHINDPPERPSRQVLEIPVWLDTLIMHLLEKDPEQRPYSAAAVGEALVRAREKALAQQSAGADVVRSRAIDRRAAGPGLEEEDKEAARTLLGKKKRKRTHRGEPFYRRVWFRAAVLAALLAGIGWVFWVVVIKPPSLDTLYDRAAALVDNPETLQEARNGPLADFLHYYPDRDDFKARQMHTWADEADRALREEQMYRRRKNDLEPDGADKAAEVHARLALTAEEKGDLPAAQNEWKAMLPWKKKEDRDLRAWGLVAEKHYNDVLEVRKRYDEIKSKTRLEHLSKKPYEATTTAGQEAVQAVRAQLEAERAQQKGDAPSAKKYWADARSHWESVRAEAQRESSRDNRLWEFMARWRLRELPEVKTPDKQPREPTPAGS
jgi:serine/threonine-protein kinase